MTTLNSFFKMFIPKFLFSTFGKGVKGADIKEADKPNSWSGEYSTWEDAMVHCTGFDSNFILEKCRQAALKVKNGEAVYQRDTTLFDEIQYSWGVLSGLQRAALENSGRLCVLDFGGSLGSSYYQNKGFLSSVDDLQWCIVEQPNFVDCGRKDFENNQLKFYYTIEECIEKHKPNVLLLSGVLQYLDRPQEMIDKMLALDIPYLIFDILTLSDSKSDFLSIQNVPDQFFESRLAHWFFSYDKLISKFENTHTLIGSSPSYVGGPFDFNSKKCFFNFLILKRK